MLSVPIISCPIPEEPASETEATTIALRDLIAAAKAIVFACEIGSFGCGNEFKVLQASIEVAEGRPWSRIRPALERQRRKLQAERMAMRAEEERAAKRAARQDRRTVSYSH
jgi:hypothetical protein